MGESKNQQKRDQEKELIQRVVKATRKAVVTGPAAARLIGIATYSWVEKVDLVLPSDTHAMTSPHKQRDRVYRSAQLPDSNWSERDGMRTASLIRTLFDSYRYYGRREALVQIESARSKWPELTVENLLGRTKTLPRAKGLKGFRELIAYSGDTSASPLETVKRDAILRAIADGRLTGVETLEYQVGFSINDRYGMPAAAWVDFLINGHIIGEADGRLKKDGTFGDAADVTLKERHREVELQNEGAQVVRTGWFDTEAIFIGQLQRRIDMYPGVRQLANRIQETHREHYARIERRAAG